MRMFHGESTDLKAGRVPTEGVKCGIYRLEGREGAFRGYFVGNLHTSGREGAFRGCFVRDLQT